MPYNDSHHVVKTSAQWDERAIEFWVVPRGCLCVELTPNGKTKIKIGEGNKFYSQLPYVNDMSDLENYYTKEEVDNIVTNINLMAIRSTDEYDTKNDLPTSGNKLGDVRFVKSSSPSIKTDPDVYLWNGSQWIYVGYELQDIDLSQYLKKDEFHELFDPVREKVEEMYPKMHTHENKNILDRIEEPYSTAEKEKLAGLENYDDTEIRELIAETGHTHPNKPVLDTITDDSLWSESDRTKFESLHNYDDTGVKNRLTDLESTAHTHSNKNILDQVTAAFTVEDKTKLDSLHNNEVFIGTDGMYGGREGLVPAPTIIDAGKFLCADGTWRPATGEAYVEFIGATASEDGTSGLVPAPLAGEETYFLKGDGTWSEIEIQEYAPGIGISFAENPNKFHEIEYLEYDGYERLNTGVKVISGHQKVYIKWMWTNNANGLCLFADCHPRYYINSDLWMGARGGSSNFNVEYGGSMTWIYDARALRTIYEDELETLHRVYHRMNDETFESVNAFCNPQDQVYLFGQNTPTGTTFYGTRRIYAFKLWDDDVLKLDMIPVRRVDGVLGMYDKVSGTFKTIAHPENLSAGPDSGTVIGDFELIVNDGVIDITQDDITALNELTVHFSATTKTLTIPTYTLQPATTSTLGGIIVGDNLTIDQNGVLSATGGGTEYTEGDGIHIDQNTINARIGEGLRFDSGQGPSGAYKSVDYIESTGTQGMSLGWGPSTTNLEYELDFSDLVRTVDTNWYWMLGGNPNSTTRSGGFCYTIQWGYTGLLVPIGNNEQYKYTTFPSAARQTRKIVVDGNRVECFVDGVSMGSNTYQGTVSGGMGLFGCDYQTTAGAEPGKPVNACSSFKFYGLKIKEGGVLVRDFIPAKRVSDGALGVWDKITYTFIPNANGGVDFNYGQETGDITIPRKSIVNTGLLSVEQDQQDLHKLIFDTIDGDVEITIPDNDTTYEAGQGIVFNNTEVVNARTQIPSDQYRQVRHLESDGAGYIMLDHVPSSDTGYAVQFESIDTTDLSTRALFGADTIVNGNHRNCTVAYEYYDNTTAVAIMNGNDSNSTIVSRTNSSLFNNGQTINYDAAFGWIVYYSSVFNAKGYRTSVSELGSFGVSYTSGKGGTTQPIALFGVNTYDTTNNTHEVVNRGKYKLICFSIIKGANFSVGTTISEMFPCYRLSDGRYGVYDTIQHEFYPVNDNACFTVGPDATNSIQSDESVINAKIGNGLKFNNIDAIEVKPATENSIGGIKVGEGLLVDQYGEISVDSSAIAEYTAGDGITIEPSSILYQPVEYIESTGTQYITTDIIPNVTDKIVIDIKFGSVIDISETSVTGYFNLIGVSGYGVSFSQFTDNSQDMSFYLGYSWYSGITNFQINNPNNITTRQNLTIVRGDSTYGGKSCSANSTVTITPTSPIDIFGYYKDTAGSEQHFYYRGFELYVYGIKIYDSSNQLIHDIIPVKRILDNEPGLYDLTTDTFFSNVGTGTFNVGSDQGTPIGPDEQVISAKIDSTLSFDSNGNISVNQMTGADGTNAGTSGTVPAPTATDNTKFLKGDGTWANPPSYTLPVATTSTLGGVKVGAGLSMNANDELGVTSPYVTSVANQGSTPGVITVAKSDGTSSDVDVLDNLRLILNCNFDSSQNQTQLGEAVDAPVAGNTEGSPIIGDLTVLEV